MLTLKDKGLLFYIIEHCKRIEEKYNEVLNLRLYCDAFFFITNLYIEDST